MAFSKSGNVEEGCTEIFRSIDEAAEGRIPKLIIFSAENNIFSLCSKKLAAYYNKSEVIGMTSFVNFSSLGYDSNGLSAMAIYDGIECVTGSIFEVSKYPMRYKDGITKALEGFDSYENMVCLEFTTAIGKCEELVQDTYKVVLKDKGIPICGGSAGAADSIIPTLVSLNGVTYSEASVFALIKNLNGGVHIFRENLFKPTKYYYTATDVDCDERTVYEYDNRPAAVVVANALQCSMYELDGNMFTHPVGRVEGDNIYITEVDKVYPDGKISYFSRIYNLTQLVQLEPDDSETVWDRTAAAVKEKGIKPEFTVAVNCSSRTRFFYMKDLFGKFQKKLADEYGDYIGVSGFGEQTEFEHLNQTMLLLMFE